MHRGSAHCELHVVWIRDGVLEVVLVIRGALRGLGVLLVVGGGQSGVVTDRGVCPLVISCRAQTRLLADVLLEVTVLPDIMGESEHDDQHQRLPGQLLHHLLQPQPLLPLMTQESLPLFP